MSTVDFKALGENVEVQFPLAVHAPFDPAVDYYLNSNVAGLGKGYAVPMEYSGCAKRSCPGKKAAISMPA